MHAAVMRHLLRRFERPTRWRHLHLGAAQSLGGEDPAISYRKNARLNMPLDFR